MSKLGKSFPIRGKYRAKNLPCTIVMIPFIPDYHAEHYGAEGDEGERTLQNMVPDHRELLSLAKEVHGVLAKKTKKSQGHLILDSEAAIQPSQLYPHIVYLGAMREEDTHHRLHDVPHIDKGLNIIVVAHGNPKEIGAKARYNIVPKDFAELMQMAFEMAFNNHVEKIPQQVPLYVDFQTCNSAYFTVTDKHNTTRLMQDVKSASYIGQFHQEMLAFEFEQVGVSGYRGYIGKMKGKNAFTVSAEEENLDRIARSTEVMYSITHDGRVTIPRQWKFPVVIDPSKLLSRDALFLDFKDPEIHPDTGDSGPGTMVEKILQSHTSSTPQHINDPTKADPNRTAQTVEENCFNDPTLQDTEEKMDDNGFATRIRRSRKSPGRVRGNL